MKKVCVPINSPAWRHYIDEGWGTVSMHGSWVILERREQSIDPKTRLPQKPAPLNT